MSDVADNFKTVQKNISKAAQLAKRNADGVRLIAVSKMQDDDRIEAALAAGHRLFGENRVQEAKARWSSLKEKHPELALHLIGPLQTNKVRDALALFDVIETVDRESLIDEIVKEAAKIQKTLRYFVQVNTGNEDQKAGVSIENLSALLAYAAGKGLTIEGLMCIPPVNEPAGLHFALLKKLAGKHDLKELSMGMSGDYERAVMAGATYVRVGSALFGER